MDKQPDPRNIELCRTLAHLQAVIAQDRVTAEDDECIEACGTIMNFLANEWGLEVPFIWEPSAQHNLEGDDEAAQRMREWAKEEEEGINKTVEETMALFLATGEAPTELR